MADKGHSEIQILISTDVLAEGLNPRDATRLINYDLHWNPVRLMQRIGRVDRRLNPDVEAQLIADHPEQARQRGRIVFWNFLPPEELNVLLTLYSRVSHKTLRISHTFGIEGRKLLTPDDQYDALKEFNRDHEGETTRLEAMRLELQDLLGADDTLAARLDAFPGRVFSGKRHPLPGTQAVFFCYRIPHPDYAARRSTGFQPVSHGQDAHANDLPYTEEAGENQVASVRCGPAENRGGTDRNRRPDPLRPGSGHGTARSSGRHWLPFAARSRSRSRIPGSRPCRRPWASNQSSRPGWS